MFKIAKRSDGCSVEALPVSCTRKKRLQRKMTKDDCWIGVQKDISMFSKLQSDRNSPMFINCHTHAMTGNCSAS